MHRRRANGFGGLPAKQTQTLLELLEELRRLPVPPNFLSLAYTGALPDLTKLHLQEDVAKDWARLKQHPLWPKLRRNPELSRLIKSFRRPPAFSSGWL